MLRTCVLAIALGGLLAGCGGAGASAPSTTSQSQATIATGAPTSTGANAPPIGPVALELEPPADVKRAGARRLAEFERGRAAVAQLGCLACHKLAANGNGGPGPDLTRVGARLSGSRIERSLVQATEPMPSFGRLSQAKLRAIVAFLSSLGR